MTYDDKHGARFGIRLSRRDFLVLAGALLADVALGADRPASASASNRNETHDRLIVQHLKCEHRLDPLGIDVLKPLLSWTVSSNYRGARQNAYQILVSSSAAGLALEKGDLWDTGKVSGAPFSQARYAGHPLASRMQSHWKVRVWDQDGMPSAWSTNSLWTIGLLHPADWKASWIADPVLADPANRPRTPIHCYRSEIANSPDTEKWVAIDLGSSKQVDGVRINAARPDGINPDIRTTLYPVRFKLEVASSPDFHDAVTVVDQTGADVIPPRPNVADAEHYRFSRTSTRYIRLSVTRLPLWDGKDYCIGLGRFQVFDGDNDIAVGASAVCSDSVETDQWSKKFLTDPGTSIAYNSFPASLLTQAQGVNSRSRVSAMRREFNVAQPVRNATLYCAARGFYEASINGRRVGEDLLSEGFTEYTVRIQYQTYDVTKMIRPGSNAIGALLGYGWYAGRMNLNDNEYFYGFFPQFLAQLDIEYADGRHDIVASDGQWKSTLEGPVLWADILDGHGYDCRKEMPGWNASGFNEASWKSVDVIPRDDKSLVWQRTQPICRMEEINPVDVKQVASGAYVFDIGQEISGWCRLKINGPAGTMIKVNHAEQRNADGTLTTQNLWGTPAEEDYILDGTGERTFEPNFTWHGFRFVQVSGLTQPPTADTLVAVHIRSSAPNVSRFECSNALYNKLMNASRWTEQNLLFDVPAGCAGRDERLGWMGDIRPCVQTALYHFDSAAFFEKVAADMRVDQTKEGRFTDIAPHAHLKGTQICVGSPGWADAGVSLPWQLYVNTGDSGVLADHYQAARRWVDFIYANNPDFLWSNQRGMSWGDWLSAGSPTPQAIGSTAFFAQDADILSRMAKVLGYERDAARYKALFSNIRSAFVKEFVSTEGVIAAKTTLDATNTVQALVQGDQLDFTVKNDILGGDPSPNQVKTLHLVYKIGETQNSQDFPEDGNVSLRGNGQPIKIVSAIYGTAGNSDVQGSYALALRFGLLGEPLRSRAAARLAEVIKRDRGHTSTGFWSSVELIQSLSEYGQHEVAAQLMNLTSLPSWGYMVQGDGSTMWESFDANTHDLSLNHWTHSAVGEWLWQRIAGIAPDPGQPGYRNVLIKPQLCSTVDWSKASYNCTTGLIEVAWKRQGASFSLDITIPANATATIFVPVGDREAVTESGEPVAAAKGVRKLRREMGNVVYQVASGAYRFVSQI